MIDDRGRLEDIQEAIGKILARTGAGEEAFNRDEMLQVWVLHHLQIIGEAVSRLTPELLERYPQVPWRNMIGMRNILAHQYFEVDLAVVWQVVDRDIPSLKMQIMSILKDLSN
ncbi:DUF86 domain-containing protein [bacterium]|nr:DUF86 domain-containing protein [bacterium]